MRVESLEKCEGWGLCWMQFKANKAWRIWMVKEMLAVCREYSTLNLFLFADSLKFFRKIRLSLFSEFLENNKVSRFYFRQKSYKKKRKTFFFIFVSLASRNVHGSFHPISGFDFMNMQKLFLLIPAKKTWN